MVTRFVKVVAAKMTDVDRLTMQRKGTSLGDRSDWEDENRDVPGYTWSLAQGTEETVDPLSEIRAPQEHLPVPRVLNMAGYIGTDSLYFGWSPISAGKPGEDFLSCVVDAPEDQPPGLCCNRSHL